MKKLILIVIACVASVTTTASTPDTQLDPLDSEEHPKITKLKLEVPKEMEPIIESALRVIDGARAPASVQLSNTRRTLSSTVSDGFEFKVRQGPRVTAFWLKKNGDQFDLIFHGEDFGDPGAEHRLFICYDKFQHGDCKPM